MWRASWIHTAFLRACARELPPICKFDDKIGVNFSAEVTSGYVENQIEHMLLRDFCVLFLHLFAQTGSLNFDIFDSNFVELISLDVTDESEVRQNFTLA